MDNLMDGPYGPFENVCYMLDESNQFSPEDIMGAIENTGSEQLQSELKAHYKSVKDGSVDCETCHLCQ